MGEWMSGAQIAELALPGLPASERGILKRASSDQWISRPRSGRGGGVEYHVSALPDAARAELERRARAAQALAVVTEKAVTVRRQIEAVDPARLTARQRVVMEARAVVLLDLDRRQLEGARSASAAVAGLLADREGGRLDTDVAAALARATGGKRLCRATLFNWLAARQQAGTAAALAPAKREKADLPEWFDRFLRHWGLPAKPALDGPLGAYAQFIRDLKAAGTADADLPTLRQVRLAMDKVSHLVLARGREGRQALKARMAYVSRDASELMPTTIYVADGTTFDAEVAHPIHGRAFRPEITVILDVTTRACVGWSAGLSESFDVVADAVRRAVRHGVPALFYTDRGRGYDNEAMSADLTGLLGRLGTTHMRALPYNSQAKGVVERFQARWIALAKTYPTFTGADMDRQARQAAFKATRRDIALTGQSAILPTWSQLVLDIEAMVDEYNASPHDGLAEIRDPLSGRKRHMSPAEAWAAWTDRGFEPDLLTPAALDDLARPWVERTVRRCLVSLGGNEYFDLALTPYHERTVIVGYDIGDASRVTVREIDTLDGKRVPGRFICVAGFEANKRRYIPVSMERQALEKRAIARHGRLAAHLDTVEAELAGARLIEASALMPLPLLAPEQPVRSADEGLQRGGPVDARTDAPVADPGGDPGIRPVFRSDVEFCRYFADRPDGLDGDDIAYLAALLASPTQREALRMAGVDIGRLRLIVDAADDRAA